MTTRRASSGSRRPGGTNTTSTSGSARSGSRSSKLAMRDSIGTATFNRLPPAAPGRSSTTASSAGSSAASLSHGTTPNSGQPVKRPIAAMPSSNSDRSPRNLLMI